MFSISDPENTKVKGMAVRKYEPIWKQLKESNKVSVRVPRPLHPRVIKAVIKEKYSDLGYKLLLGERGKNAKLSYHVQGVVITFQLSHTFGVEDL